MGSDDEIFEDEEDILVYVEFEGLVDGNVFNEKELQLDMIGIDTEHPIMQINGKFYEGTYEDISGTYMFFTKNNNSLVDDCVFDDAPNLKYFAKTRKFLKMQRIFTKSRTEVLGDSEHNQCIPNLNTLKQAGIPFQYQEEALLFWKTMRNNRLNALHSYLEKQRVRQHKRSQGIALESESDEDNPFAMYKHREEIFNLNETENVIVDSNCCDNQIYQEFMFPEETSNKNLGLIKSNTLEELKRHTVSSHSKLLTSKDDDYHLLQPAKDYKTKIPLKKKQIMTRDRQKMKLKKKQISLKGDKVISLGISENKLLNSEMKSEDEEDNISITETVSSLETNENIRGSNDCKIAITEKLGLGADQIDSKNSKIIKTLKREAKMKEISQQLKVIAEEHIKQYMKID